MRIAIVHSFYSSVQPSGENAIVLEQAELLRSAGHIVSEIYAYTDELSGQIAYPVRTAVAVATGGGCDPSSRLALFSPDVVSLHNTFPNWGRGWLRRWSTRTVQTVHNYRMMCAKATFERDGSYCEECPTHGSIRGVLHACYRDSRLATVPLALATRRATWPDRSGMMPAKFVFLNREAMERHKAYMPTMDAVLIPNFVSPARDREARDEARSGYVYAGRLTDEKGINWLMRHWPSNARLDVIGDGPLRGAVEAWAAGRTGVRYVGVLPREAVRQRLGRYKALIFPSLWSEGLPTIMLEALAAGTPIVVSSIVAESRKLEGAGVAFPFSPGDGHGGVTSALAALGKSIGIHGAARRHFEREYSPQRWLERMSIVYDDIQAKNAAAW